MDEVPIPPVSPGTPEFKDRSTGLIVFGVIEILLGLLAALMIPLMLLGQIMSAKVGQEAPPLRQMIPGASIYGFLAVTLIGLGIGSCKTRRWARALTLVFSWSWLAIGSFSMISMAIFLPRVMKAAQPQGQSIPETMRLTVMIITFVMMGIIYVIIPGILVFFYQSRHVKATCEARNAAPCWTDACPLPVLGMSLWAALGAIMMPSMSWGYNFVLPVFGVLLSGWQGALVLVAVAAIWAYSSWAIYHLKLEGWWILLVTTCLGCISAAVTFLRIDMMEMYRIMGFTEQQMKMVKQMSFLSSHDMLYFSLAGMVPWLGFLFFIKRYFRRSA